MKIIVDRARCKGLGVCELWASSYFEVNDSGEMVLLKDDVADEDLASVVEAVAMCPSEALHFKPWS
jgi:ferredoxin